MTTKPIEHYIGFIVEDKDMPVDGPIFVNLEEIGLAETINLHRKNTFPGIHLNETTLKSKNAIKKYTKTALKEYPNARVIILDAFTTEVVVEYTQENFK